MKQQTGLLSTQNQRPDNFPRACTQFLKPCFNVHHKDWVTYSGETGRPYKLYYDFSISTDLTQIVNVPTGILDCDPDSISSAMAFPPLGNSDYLSFH